MYTIRVTALTKEDLPKMMLVALRGRRRAGLLDGLIHAEDDIVRKVDYGWEMLSFWGTPEEVKVVCMGRLRDEAGPDSGATMGNRSVMMRQVGAGPTPYTRRLR